MRPTWHFVAPEDLRWLLALTAPRVHQASAYQYRLLELDLETRKRTREVIRGLLAGGRAMLRDELAQAMSDAGVLGSRLRLGYMLIDAELEAIICSGPRRGKRQTYALVDERVAPSRPREHDEALAELAMRYVAGHGPAQDIDLAWWSGLTLRDARRALEAAGDAVTREDCTGRTFWVGAGSTTASGASGASGVQPAGDPDARPTVRLLPNYDELLVAFRDRSDAVDPRLPGSSRSAAAILAHVIVRHGLVVGGWKRRDLPDATMVALDLLVEAGTEDRVELRREVQRLEAFLGRSVEVSGLD